MPSAFLPLLAAVMCGRVQGLGARWHLLRGALIGRDHLLERPVERRHQVAGLEQADVDLLVPIAELGALEIVGQRLLAFAAVPIALRQIEGVARDQERIGLGRERALQNRRVVLILARILAARAAGAGVHRKSLHRFAGEFAGGRLEIFVQHALE